MDTEMLVHPMTLAAISRVGVIVALATVERAIVAARAGQFGIARDLSHVAMVMVDGEGNATPALALAFDALGAVDGMEF